jgi:voltage-gated potassium channel
MTGDGIDPLTDSYADTDAPPAHRSPLRAKIHEIIFEADTPPGKAFDVVLLVLIVLSIVAVSLESVDWYRQRFGTELRVLEWIFTILFTIEYALRVATVRRPSHYVFSFFGAVDLLSILPTYLSLLFAGTQSLLVIRALRLLRVFRVLKLAHFLGEAHMLKAALQASLRKIVVFLGAVLAMVMIVGALMYLIEGPENGFTSIPTSIYWAIVTMTTVGYGDIAPQTVLGKTLASAVMILGYGVLAVPTGIVTVELAGAARRDQVTTRACSTCSKEGHAYDAKFCKHCGSLL